MESINKVGTLNVGISVIDIYKDLENPLIEASSIAKLINCVNVREMVNSAVSSESKLYKVMTNGGLQSKLFLTMLGLKQVLGYSRKPNAKIILAEIDSTFILYKTPKQTDFSILLKNSILTNYNTIVEENSNYKIYENMYTYWEEYRIGKYRLDYYFPYINLIIEYDEFNHKYKKDEDKIRELEISKIIESDGNICSKQFNTKFIRVDEDNEINGIIKIVSYISNKLLI